MFFYPYSLQDIGEGSGTPLQHSCLENPMDGGAWWAAVHGVARSQTRLSDFTFTFHFHALEKEMATHSSVLAWRIPGTGEPGGLPSMGSHRVGHDWSDLAAAAAAVYICQCYSPYYFDYSIRITVYNHHSSCWSSHTVLILIEVSKLELERTYNFLDLSSLALSLIRIFSLGLPVFIRTTFPNQA